MRLTVGLPFALLLLAGWIIPAIAVEQDSGSGEASAKWSARSRDGLYDVTLTPVSTQVEIGEFQPWVVRVTLPNGSPVYPASIGIGGGMQRHGHGLPTQPQVTAYGGQGDYLVEGVRFSMEGAWRLSVYIQSAHGNDRADVDMELTIGSPAKACGDCPPRTGAGEGIWTGRELRILESLRLDADDAPLPAPSNKYAASEAAAALGRRLFFDSRLSGNGKVSCATCHQPDRYYTDGLPRSRGTGQVARNAPTVVGAAWQRWFYWDGRRDSLWAQSLIPFEAAEEMGGSRLAVIRTVSGDPKYRELYAALFGELPAATFWEFMPEHAGPYGQESVQDNWARLSSDTRSRINRIYSNLGKSIAAFERTLTPQETRFDRYVKALPGRAEPSAESRLSADEIAGAKLFMDPGRTQCLQCHNGTVLSNGDFHNIGTGTFTGPQLDYGRVFGLRAVLMDEFNCLGPYSDAEPAQCVDLRFLNKDSHVPLEGAFKVPSLRGLKYTAPYFHDGRFATLSDVLGYYNAPPDQSLSGPHELRPLGLTDEEISQLELFLLTLSH